MFPNPKYIDTLNQNTREICTINLIQFISVPSLIMSHKVTNTEVVFII